MILQDLPALGEDLMEALGMPKGKTIVLRARIESLEDFGREVRLSIPYGHGKLLDFFLPADIVEEYADRE